MLSLTNTQKFKWFSAFIILALGIGIYFKTLDASFQFDDRDFVTQNSNIRDITDIKSVWQSLQHPSRFVTFYTFALNYHFGKYDPFGYHLVNILIHLINGLLIWTFAGFIIRLGAPNERIRSHAHIISLGVALFFISHPLQTQAVSYITQRFTSLATLFYISTLCLYIKGRLSNNYSLFAVGIITMILGMFSKQITFTLPIMIIFIEILFFRTDKQRKALNLKFLIPGLLLFCLLIPSFFGFNLSRTLGMTTASGSHDYDIINAGNYFLTQFRVIPTYLRLFVLPINQNLDYDFTLSKSLFEIKTFSGGLFLLSLFISGILLLKKNKIIGFGILWFFIAISVTSSIIPIHHVIFEHRMYLPMTGLSIAFVTALFDRIKNIRIFFIIIFSVITILSVLTVKRNEVWMTEQNLWEDIIKKSPVKAKPYSNLGTIYFENRRYEDALEMFNKAIEFLPEYSRAYNNRAAVYIYLKNPEMALADLNYAIRLGLNQSEVYSNRGDAYEQMKMYDLALADYNKAIELNPYNAKAHDNIGTILGGQGNYEGALEMFNQALTINPEFSDSYNNRGVIYLRQSKFNEAIKSITRALELDKYNVEAYNNLGLAYLNLNDHANALINFEKALKYRPNYIAPLNSIGIIYGKEERYDLAINQFNKIKAINPNFLDAYNNAGLAYRRLKNYPAALEEYDKALSINPQSAGTLYNRSLCYFDMKEFSKALEDATAAKEAGYPVQEKYFNLIKTNLKLQP